MSLCQTPPKFERSCGSLITGRTSGHRAPLDVGILDDLAEAAREAQQRRGRELLVAKEDHDVLEQRLAQGGDSRVVERRREIDPADLGAERRAEPSDIKSRHGCQHDLPPSGRRCPADLGAERRLSRRISSRGMVASMICLPSGRRCPAV